MPDIFESLLVDTDGNFGISCPKCKPGDVAGKLRDAVFVLHCRQCGRADAGKSLREALDKFLDCKRETGRDGEPG